MPQFRLLLSMTQAPWGPLPLSTSLAQAPWGALPCQACRLTHHHCALRRMTAAVDFQGTNSRTMAMGIAWTTLMRTHDDFEELSVTPAWAVMPAYSSRRAEPELGRNSSIHDVMEVPMVAAATAL